MYIRRKVYSVALDEYGEERYFSTNEIVNEEDYLQEMMYADAPAAEAAAEKAPSWLAKKAGAVKKWYMNEGKTGWKGLNKTKAGLTAAGVAAIPGAIYGIKALKRRKARKAAEAAAAAELAEANYSDYYENLYSDDEVPSEEEMVVVPKKALSKKAKMALAGGGAVLGGAGIGAATGLLKKNGVRRAQKFGQYAKRAGIGAASGAAAAGLAYGGYRGVKALKARKARKAAEAALAAEEAGEE